MRCVTITEVLSRESSAKRIVNSCLFIGIDGGSWFIQNDEIVFTVKASCNCDTLPLPAGKIYTVKLTREHGIVPICKRRVGGIGSGDTENLVKPAVTIGFLRIRDHNVFPAASFDNADIFGYGRGVAIESLRIDVTRIDTVHVERHRLLEGKALKAGESE